MNLSVHFVRRPVATGLLTLALVVAGAVSGWFLPLAPMPDVEYPTVQVSAALPGASPETMAATVATPLERALGSIAGVTEMTSVSTLGNTRITLQFELERNGDGAVRDVEAALSAARAALPAGLPNNPTWRKVNPADGPVLVIALTSSTRSRAELYDAASTVLAQRLSQVDGIGQVLVGGGALPAVRVAVDPSRLAAARLSLEDLRVAVVSANADRPKGVVDDEAASWAIGSSARADRAADFAPTIVSMHQGQPLRLRDVAAVTDSVQDERNHGAANGRPAVLLILSKAPGANVIQAVDRVRELLPQLAASIPPDIDMQVVIDRTPTLRGSLREVRHALLTSAVLVVGVVLLFLRSARAALVPAVAVPTALAGTLAMMALAGFSINNLTLMAMTVATGFVVDDAIVVVENISRHRERGVPLRLAVERGAGEIAFTVMAISLALVAAFIPILFMGGLVGRLFREFALVLATAVGVSMLVSLTTAPMLAARWLPALAPGRGSVPLAGMARGWAAVARGYRRSLRWVLRRPIAGLALLAGTTAVAGWLYAGLPKGLFPQQDTGRLVGVLRADQSNSFLNLRDKLDEAMAIVRADPAVDSVTGFTGGAQRNQATLFISLVERDRRGEAIDRTMARLRQSLSPLVGASLFLVPVQDVRVGARMSNAQFQFTLQADTLEELRAWEPRVRRAMMGMPLLLDVNSDQQDRGWQTVLQIDRDAAARLGISVRAIDLALNDAFGQRQIGVIYNPLNQYRVVMELAPEFLQHPASLDRLMLQTASGDSVPLTAIAKPLDSAAALVTNHQGGMPAATISFNLPEGVALSQAAEAVNRAIAELGVPPTVRVGFQGTAAAFRASLRTMPLLLLAAVLTVYFVLGMLYESALHPLTILSTLPSAAVGALLGLRLTELPFTLIALIGLVLLIGIVMKNAIMLIDFALGLQRQGHCSAGAAIYKASQQRLRPILMTTAAAVLGALPLAMPEIFGGAEGSELRQPLGIAVVGGLLLSQWLTLYTVPAVFLLLERVRRRGRPLAAAPLKPELAR